MMKVFRNAKIRLFMIILISVMLLSIFSFFIYSYFSMNLILVGNEKITLNYAEKYKEPGYKASVLWFDSSKDVDIISNLKADLGEYQVLYKYKFLCYIKTKKRKIKIVDKEKPVIELQNGELMQIYENETYVEPGYKATDNKDGDITDKVKVEGTVDVKTIGEYTIEYSVTDSSGNTSKIQRKVKVVKDDRYKKQEMNYTDANGGANFVIAGDSNIKNMYLNGYVGKGNAWAIPCLHAQSMQSTAVYIYGTNQQMTILEATDAYKPENLVLYFGAFSTIWITEDEFDQGSINMINQIKNISPGTKVYLLSILPITQYGPNINNFSQATIDYFNTKIATLAANNGLKYLDAHAIFKDQAGYANTAYYVGDGYHLNATGHRMLRNYINANL